MYGGNKVRPILVPCENCSRINQAGSSLAMSCTECVYKQSPSRLPNFPHETGRKLTSNFVGGFRTRSPWTLPEVSSSHVDVLLFTNAKAPSLESVFARCEGGKSSSQLAFIQKFSSVQPLTSPPRRLSCPFSQKSFSKNRYYVELEHLAYIKMNARSIDSLRPLQIYTYGG